jgi:hypothetical protein
MITHRDARKVVELASRDGFEGVSVERSMQHSGGGGCDGSQSHGSSCSSGSQHPSDLSDDTILLATEIMFKTVVVGLSASGFLTHNLSAAFGLGMQGWKFKQDEKVEGEHEHPKWVSSRFRTFWRFFSTF